MDTALTIAKYILLLLFGVFTSAAFCNIHLNKINVCKLLALSIFALALEIGAVVLFSDDTLVNLYPLITHLPIVLFYIIFYKKKISTAVFAVMTSYMACSVTEWIGITAEYLSGQVWVYYCVRFIAIILIGILIVGHLASSIAPLLNKSTKSTVIFGIVPMAYYLISYGTTVYSDLMYSSNRVYVEFLPFSFCLFYFMFCFIYFNEYEEKQRAKRYNQIMLIQSKESKREIEAIKQSEVEIVRLRHDMRHYISHISTLIENSETEKALSYMKELNEDIEKTSQRKYCKNNLINLILSYYYNKMSEKNIEFVVTADITNKLQFSEVDFTSVLANALENAMNATEQVKDDKKIIYFSLLEKDKKILLSIKNPVVKTPKFVDDLPVCNKKDHGIGTQSIKYIAEKLGGICKFSSDNQFFILYIVLWNNPT